ncbi:lactonase family protein [Solwaraspora sp. WMMD406]|uniref:lactonase family protein n=1 Tax=Solwaraspora sp. WMMD406 TaxID=3016095 RepID=UPI00241789EC|nr:lactonase family protein [Solwaraspora sp. WMMD406]MDG4767400.1 lactonase family protein [Solwaraspora sp. WMMD406]
MNVDRSSSVTTVYLGCYTADGDGRGAGIMRARRDPATGWLEPPTVVARTASPSFLARHPRQRVLYAVSEVEQGAVGAWSVDDEGELHPLGSQDTGGSSPCHLAVAGTGGHLVSANYGSGGVAVHPLTDTGAVEPRSDLRQHTGSGPDSGRQEGPHAHMVSPDPGGPGLYVVDLGADAVHRYLLDPATGTLAEPDPASPTRPGGGPRHLARHPAGGHAYLVGELDASVTAYEIDGTGGLVERERVAASAEHGPVQPSEIAVRPDGRFLYVANRGVDTIAVFDLADAAAPRYVAEVSTGGRWPRHFAVIGPHLYVANERSDSIGVYVIDDSSGVPVALGDSVPVLTPTCVLPVPW